VGGMEGKKEKNTGKKINIFSIFIDCIKYDATYLKINSGRSENH
jgi:hypothetical protein